MLASFHSSGRTPQEREELNSRVSDGAICCAVSFSRRVGIPSGPVALLQSSDANMLRTSSVVSNTSDMVLPGDEEEGGDGA